MEEYLESLSNDELEELTEYNIEDIYIEEDMRGTGLADEFLSLVKAEYPKHIHRLEAEHDNYRAIHSYEKNEFEKMPYLEMIRFPDKK